MKIFFKYLLTPIYLHRFENGKFFKAEMLYYYFLISCIIVSARYGYIESHPEANWEVTLACFLPFITCFLSVAKTIFWRTIHQISDIPKELWITRLFLAHKWWFPLSAQDKRLKESLDERFQNVYGIRVSEIKYVRWMQIGQVLLLPVLCSIAFLLFA